MKAGGGVGLCNLQHLQTQNSSIIQASNIYYSKKLKHWNNKDSCWLILFRPIFVQTHLSIHKINVKVDVTHTPHTLFTLRFIANINWAFSPHYIILGYSTFAKHKLLLWAFEKTSKWGFLTLFCQRLRMLLWCIHSAKGLCLQKLM